MSDPVWPHQKHYWAVHRNFYGCLKKDLPTESERKIMETELRRAKRALDEAKEKHHYDK